MTWVLVKQSRLWLFCNIIKRIFPSPVNKDISDELTLFRNTETNLTSLLIVPASLIYNWENEIKRFVPEMKVISYKGNQRKKSTSYFNNFDIILSSYHTIRQDIDLISYI